MTGEPLGWWTLSGEALMEMLARCHTGEDPWAVYLEFYANSDHEHCGKDDDGRGEAGPAVA